MPLYLEVTLDGISGMIIGQIFTVNTDTLPDDYARNAMGFMVTALSHHMKGSDWTTVVGTKPVLLNQDKLGDPKLVSARKEGVEKAIYRIKNRTIEDANRASVAYMKLMCFIKLYYENSLKVTATIVRVIPASVDLAPFITLSSVDPTHQPDMTVDIQNYNISLSDGNKDEVIFTSKIGASQNINYTNIMYLTYSLLHEIPTEISKNTLVNTFVY